MRAGAAGMAMDSYLRLHTGLHLVLSATSFHIASSLVYLCPVVSRTLLLGYNYLMGVQLDVGEVLHGPLPVRPTQVDLVLDLVNFQTPL